LVAVLPQPFVTTVMAKNPELRVALDFTQEWDSATDSQSALVTGVLIVRKEFLTENKVAFDAYLDEYRASTQYVNANPGDAAALVVKYGIIGNAEIAKKAIPQCNITFLEGSELITKAGGYLKALYEQNPASVGGALPDENFYYQR
jgi:NitT/TauT family transport system substrate-binding protein